jgi:putative colanic acid biosynthesis acetyltransferase WcaF
MARVHLGRDALVSQGAQLCTGTHQIDDPGFPLRTKPIIIGPKAWIAANAFVGPGVDIGEGAVLGACAVAFSNLRPWTVWAGNPARFLRERSVYVRKAGREPGCDGGQSDALPPEHL